MGKEAAATAQHCSVPLSPAIPASAGSQGELVHNEGIWGERGHRGEQYQYYLLRSSPHKCDWVQILPQRPQLVSLREGCGQSWPAWGCSFCSQPSSLEARTGGTPKPTAWPVTVLGPQTPLGSRGLWISSQNNMFKCPK